jgi:hypothetical protein
VQGTWRAPNGVLSLTQRYQMVEGTFGPADSIPQSVNGRLRGKAITLRVGETEYEGVVTGKTIEAAAKGPAGARIATRRVTEPSPPGVVAALREF